MFARPVSSIHKGRGCVSNFALVPGSSLDSFRGSLAHREMERPGVTIAERTGISLSQVLASRGAEVQLGKRILEVFNIALPLTPRYVGSSAISFVWAGPSQWLALGEQRDGQAFASSLSSSLLGLAATVDQSDGRAIIRVGGPRIRDALAKGLHIDLHPSVFRIRPYSNHRGLPHRRAFLAARRCPNLRIHDVPQFCGCVLRVADGSGCGVRRDDR